MADPKICELLIDDRAVQVDVTWILVSYDDTAPRLISPPGTRLATLELPLMRRH